MGPPKPTSDKKDAAPPAKAEQTGKPKKVQRRRKRGRPKKRAMSDNICSSSPSSHNSGGSFCCSTSVSCSSSDSDYRFSRYYSLTADEAPLRHVELPSQAKKKRNNMTKLLLHTMVMWDDIWQGGKSDKETEKEESEESSESEMEGDPFSDFHRAYQKNLASKRLHQTLNMTEDFGEFFSGRWYGLPTEEIDPYIYDDTFCVLSWKSKGPCLVYRYYKGDSLGLFSPDHPLRVFCLRVISHRYFSMAINCTIFANCITLACETYDYNEYGKKFESIWDRINAIMELTFLFIYTVEMILKIIAKGFVFHRMAYLRNGWNLLDFIVVITNYVSHIIDYVNNRDFDLEFEGTKLEFLRIFRVLRIVKAINVLPGLRKIVNALINSSRQLFEVLGLTVFAIMMFSLFGMEFFSGKFRQKCVRIKGEGNEDTYTPDFSGITGGLSSFMTDRLYAMWTEDEHNWLYRDNPETEPVPCGNGTTARLCPPGFVCLEVGRSQNPNHGWLSFDTFTLAALQTLQVMTLDYWERTYELALSTVGMEGCLYFVMVIFFGGFYLLNLILAVVTLSYDKEQDVNIITLPISKRLALTRDMSVFTFEHLNQQRIHLFEGFHEKTKRERDEILLRMLKADEFKHPRIEQGRFETSQQCTHAMYNLLGKLGRYDYPPTKKSEADVKERAKLDMHRTPLPEDGCIDEFVLFDGESDAELTDKNDPQCLTMKNGKIANFNMVGYDQTFVIQNRRRFVKLPVKEVNFSLFPPEDNWDSFFAWCSVWSKATQPIVEDWRWKNAMILCIFINTVISCLEHHGQPFTWDVFIHVSSDIFTYIFCFELFLKFVAYQGRFFEYGWNKFDFCVVVGSVIDTIVQDSVGYKGLRGLKLLRILRLAQAWDTMKVLLNILFSAIGDMANLVLILFFAIYIFAMFGMQFIGTGYAPRHFQADFYPANYPRWAWQTSVHSFLMVFRIVSGEWVELTWECLSAYRERSEEYKCFITLIPMLVLGNFIVLNLFLALLLHIFDADEINSLNKNVKADRRERVNSFRSNLRSVWKRIKAKCMSRCCRKNYDDPDDPNKKKSKIKLKLTFKKKNKVVPEEVAQTQTEQDVENLDLEEEIGSLIEVIEEEEPVTKEDGDVAVAAAAGGGGGSKQYHVIIPHALPKWRLYKVVTKYIEVGGNDDDSDQDNVEDELLDVPKYKFKEQRSETYFLTMKNRRFRQAAYKILLLIRKRKARIVLKKYTELKQAELKNECLATPISKASRLAVSSMKFSAVENDELVLHPCIPSFLKCKWCPKCRWFDYLRFQVLRFVTHHLFEWFMLILIFSSSILLCFEDIHIQNNPVMRDILYYAGAVFTGLFIIEFFLQLFAQGFFRYFTNAWSLLDCFALIVGIVSVYIDYMERQGNSHWRLSTVRNLGGLKALRTLRCIRPLRAISRWQGMKIVVNSLIQAIPAIFNVFCVCLVFWLVFAIMGVQFFKGRLFKCVNRVGETVDATVAPNRHICCQKADSDGFAWVNSFPNFDNVPQAYLSLLYLATFEGWMDVIRSGTDARDIDQQPMREYDMKAYIFFVMFCLFGGFLTMKLFIGVIIDNFNMLKSHFEGNLYEALMSPNQWVYYKLLKKLGRKHTRFVRPKPKNPARLAFFEIAISERTEFFMFCVVVLNMISMCCDGYGNSILRDSVLEALNAFFIYIYTIEATVKIIALGSEYFRSGWNIFDIVILVVSAIDYSMGDMIDTNFPVPPSVVRLCRILRVGRVMRLMKSAKGIRRLVLALLVSIPALFNVGALLVLVMFIYSILGMSLFGKFGPGGALDEIVNFETFPQAYLLLFRHVVYIFTIGLITVAGWNDLLITLIPAEIQCGSDEEDDPGEYELPDCAGAAAGKPDCTGFYAPVAFVVTYLIITNFVIVNMYIAIILENFDQARTEDDFEVTGDDVDIFLDKWAIFDGSATQFMELKYLAPFLDILEPPLRMKYPNQTAITALDIPIYQRGLVQIYDVMRNLMVFVMGHAETTQMEEIQRLINSRFAHQFRQKRILPLVSTTRIWKIQHNAATYIQRFWRNYRKGLEEKKNEQVQNVPGQKGRPATPAPAADPGGPTNEQTPGQTGTEAPHHATRHHGHGHHHKKPHHK